MNARFTFHARRILRCAGVVLLLAILSNSRLPAQFQSVFGGLAHDAAKGGVIQTRDGNIVAVGYSSSFTPDQDVYVVKSNACGFVVWARTYDLGGADAGRKIRQLSDGSLIVVGSTENSRNCCTRNDAFLLKLDANGNVQWAKTYGGLDDDQGMDVIVPNGADVVPTFTVAGRSASFGRGDYDAWLFRTDATGNLIWGRVYGDANADGFSSLDINCDGNIVAAGSSRSFSLAGDEDIFVVWASPVDGQPVRSMLYGDAGDEGAHCIVNNGSALYVAGYTTSLGSGTEAYVLALKCGSGLVDADRAFGGNGTIGDDQFTEIQLLPSGNLILTGFLEDAPGGFGSYDVFLTELDPALGRVFSDVYGGPSIDQGWSVAVVNPADRRYRLVQAGLTYSFGFGRVDLYEILTNSIGGEACNTAEPQLQTEEPGFTASEVRPPNSRTRVGCDVRVAVGANRQYQNLCGPCDQPADQDIEHLSQGASAEHGAAVRVSSVVVR